MGQGSGGQGLLLLRAGEGQLLGYGMLTQVVTDCLRNARSLWLHALVIEAVYFTELVVEPRANRCPKRMLG